MCWILLIYFSCYVSFAWLLQVSSHLLLDASLKLDSIFVCVLLLDSPVCMCLYVLTLMYNLKVSAKFCSFVCLKCRSFVGCSEDPLLDGQKTCS